MGLALRHRLRSVDEPGRTQPKGDGFTIGAQRCSLFSPGTYRSEDLATTFRRLLGGKACVAAVSLDVEPPPLFPEEAAAAANMAPARRHEFALGRYCVHVAMADLGVTPVAVPLGVDRGPLWPRSVIGSISHWGSWCVAAVMETGGCRSFGIDGERSRGSPAGLLSEVATASEHAWLESADGAFEWAAALFSMKEAVYKAWAPVTGIWLEFKDVEIAVELETGTFCAEIPEADRHHRETTEIHGHFAFEGDSVLAVAFLQSPPGGPATASTATHPLGDKWRKRGVS